MPPRHRRGVQKRRVRVNPSPKKRREHPSGGAVRSDVKVRAGARKGVGPTVTTLGIASRWNGRRGTYSSDLQTPLPKEAAAPNSVTRVAPRRERRGHSCMKEGADPADPSCGAAP